MNQLEKDKNKMKYSKLLPKPEAGDREYLALAALYGIQSFSDGEIGVPSQVRPARPPYLDFEN